MNSPTHKYNNFEERMRYAPVESDDPDEREKERKIEMQNNKKL